MTGWTISIEAEGPAPSVEALEEFSEVLSELGAGGPAVGSGGLVGGATATYMVDVAADDLLGVADVVRVGVELFTSAAEKAGVVTGIVRVDLMSAPAFDRWLEREPESYLGASEIAELLGVSRQRVAELRRREDFPNPIAELAAGPVWTLTSLRRFISEWPRRPGRPRK